MKTIIFLLFISLYSGLCHAQGALSIEVNDLNGNRTTIAETVKSDILVLDFWATWCKPCIKSIPKLVELSKKYHPDTLSFIGINVDSPRNINKIKPTVNALKISYPVLHDINQSIMSDLQVSALPTLVVLNHKGKILYFHEGYFAGDEIQIEKKLSQLIKKK